MLEHTSHKVRATRTERLVYILGGLTVILLIGLAVTYVEVQSLRHDNRVINGQKNALGTALATANSSVAALGGTPVSTPTSAAPAPTATVTVSGQRGATGEQGSGPSDVQVLAAVTLYCSDNVCGAPPSAAQVAKAVVTYCSTGVCKGAPATSIPGPSGMVGPTGAAGQNATPDEIAQAVADYCAAHGNCAGPTGPTGAAGPSGTSGTDGASGQPGPAIPSFTFSFTDELGVTHDYTCAEPDYACVSTNSAQGGN